MKLAEVTAKQFTLVNVLNKENRLIPKNIKGTMHSLKNSNHINKISYMLPEIWLPNVLIYFTLLDAD